MNKSDIWVQFACAALHVTDNVTYSMAATTADAMLLEYEARFGDKAVIIDGVKTCFSCAKLITGEYVVSDGKDGEYKKFCAECVEKHKKGEAISSPGIAICIKCGQHKGTIFKCPEGPAPRQLTDELFKKLSEEEIAAMVHAEQSYRNKLTDGPEHTF